MNTPGSDKRAAGRLDGGGPYVQAALFAGLCLFVCLLAAVHLAVLARPIYVVGGIILALYCRSRSPFGYVTMTLWFWSVSPFVRRVVDEYGGFAVQNIVLIAPNVLCLIMFWDIVASRRLFTRKETTLCALAVAAVCYGLCVSLFRGQIFAGAVAALDWYCPIAYYLYFLAHTRRIGEAERYFNAFVPLNLLIVGGYGVFQYVAPPEWDINWVLQTKMTTVGLPQPFGLKAFSTLNGPGVCAAWIAAIILLSLHFRSWLTIIAMPAALLLLSFTLVRSVVGATVLSFLLAMLLGPGRMVRAGLLVFVTVAIAGAVVGMLDPRAGEALSKRFDTINHLDKDTSARAREELYREGPGMISEHAMGMGIGAIGRGAVESGNDNFVSLDSGPIAIYITLGWVAGSIYLFGMLGVTAQALVSAVASRSNAGLALAVTSIGGIVTIVFSNTVGAQGVVIWMSAGYASALAVRSAAPVALRRTGKPAQIV